MRIAELKIPELFKPLLGPARYKGIHGGRGGAKSHMFATLCVTEALRKPGFRAVCIREIQRSLKESVKLLIEDKIEEIGAGKNFWVRHDRIITPGDGVILFQGMQDHTAESIKSLEGMDAAYGEEAQTLTDRSLELLRPTIRKPGSELWFAWNPRHPTDAIDQLLRKGPIPPNSIVIEANWRDNPFFPSILEKERLFDFRNNPDRYNHIWEGHYEPQSVGALWSMDRINAHRIADAPMMGRIVVAVDPAVSAEKGSNETGIVACGIGSDGRGYVLADNSMVGKPEEWAVAAAALYDMLEADAIVVEVNQGGDMCKATFRAVRPDVRIIEVHATRGKHIRAEPISALYSIGRISHVGAFPELEAQMCRMTASGYDGPGSPDRCDSLVWGMTSLFGRLVKKSPTLYQAPTKVIGTNDTRRERRRALRQVI